MFRVRTYYNPVIGITVISTLYVHGELSATHFCKLLIFCINIPKEFPEILDIIQVSHIATTDTL